MIPTIVIVFASTLVTLWVMSQKKKYDEAVRKASEQNLPKPPYKEYIYSILPFIVFVLIILLIIMVKSLLLINQKKNDTKLIQSACSQLNTANQLMKKPSLSDPEKQQLPSLFQSAISALKSATQLNASNPEPLYYLGLTYQILATQHVNGADTLAAKYLEEASSLNPQITIHPLCYDYLH